MRRDYCKYYGLSPLSCFPSRLELLEHEKYLELRLYGDLPNRFEDIDTVLLRKIDRLLQVIAIKEIGLCNQGWLDRRIHELSLLKGETRLRRIEELLNEEIDRQNVKHRRNFDALFALAQKRGMGAKKVSNEEFFKRYGHLPQFQKYANAAQG